MFLFDLFFRCFAALIATRLPRRCLCPKANCISVVKNSNCDKWNHFLWLLFVHYAIQCDRLAARTMMNAALFVLRVTSKPMRQPNQRARTCNWFDLQTFWMKNKRLTISYLLVNSRACILCATLRRQMYVDKSDTEHVLLLFLRFSPTLIIFRQQILFWRLEIGCEWHTPVSNSLIDIVNMYPLRKVPASTFVCLWHWHREAAEDGNVVCASEIAEKPRRKKVAIDGNCKTLQRTPTVLHVNNTLSGAKVLEAHLKFIGINLKAKLVNWIQFEYIWWNKGNERVWAKLAHLTITRAPRQITRWLRVVGFA